MNPACTHCLEDRTRGQVIKIGRNCSVAVAVPVIELDVTARAGWLITLQSRWTSSGYSQTNFNLLYNKYNGHWIAYTHAYTLTLRRLSNIYECSNKEDKSSAATPTCSRMSLNLIFADSIPTGRFTVCNKLKEFTAFKRGPVFKCYFLMHVMFWRG